MIKAWEWMKDHYGWVYSAVMLGVACFNLFGTHDVLWGVADIVVAALVLWVYQWGPFRRNQPTGGTMPPPPTFEEGEVRAILSKGMEPVGLDFDRDAHRRLNPNCILCRQEELDED